ncbi:MAG: inositol monophosphatase [Candidatus Eisenbacteria bacterium]|uniref:Inositol monophosphatase n=1 Tax=Eiseniibacteriota bacterium TaxID=2212470 RepID=A0A7Y2H410_UNCEI|nr:inositol monophosphatase [Candidatus Eisenbacteria bacterium]
MSQAFRPFLEHLVPELGKVAKARFGDPGTVEYKFPGNPVTEVDREIESLAVQAILKEFPGHAIRGEETGHTPGKDAYEWHIDPIDGTMNFVRGVPFFSVSLGVTHGNEIVAGAVLDPLRGELFVADGTVATLNENPIQVSPAKTISEAAVSLQTSSRGVIFEKPDFMKLVHRRVQKTRKLGSIALELAYVSCGRLDLLVAAKGSPQAWWDIAGGWALVTAAGGVVTDIHKQALTPKAMNLLAGPAELVEGFHDLYNNA